jgi:hypothetical protein
VEVLVEGVWVRGCGGAWPPVHGWHDPERTAGAADQGKVGKDGSADGAAAGISS